VLSEVKHNAVEYPWPWDEIYIFPIQRPHLPFNINDSIACEARDH
jgi:hypothetical protein